VPQTLNLEWGDDVTVVKNAAGKTAVKALIRTRLNRLDQTSNEAADAVVASLRQLQNSQKKLLAKTAFSLQDVDGAVTQASAYLDELEASRKKTSPK
jgi:hypothetical protein